MIASFSLLTPEELKSLQPELTVFLFPVGGLEQHGPHLPMGTKLIEAEALTRAIADELQRRLPAWSFIFMPLIPLTVDGVTRKFSLPVRPHVVRDAVVDQCEELKRLGFKNFVAVNSHLTPQQITALEDAAKIVSGRFNFGQKRHQLISVTGALVDSKQVLESPMIALPFEHGGDRDTSMMLAFGADWVSDRYRGLESHSRPKATVGRFFSWVSKELDGYWGNPALATIEKGKYEISQTAGTLAEKMIPWLEKGQGKGQFLSWYRFFPFNGSFFKAYLLAGILFLILLAWMLGSMKDAFDP